MEACFATVLTASKAVEHYQVRRQRNFQPFPKAVANPKSKSEDPLKGVSAELHMKRGKGRRMYGGKGHPYADYTRPMDKGKAAEKNLMVKRSMVATIEAPRVGPWQIGRILTTIGRIPMSNDKTWTIRLGTPRLRSVQVSMSGLELAQKATGVGFS